MASGWKISVWLECIGVVKIITFPYSTCISSFLVAASLFLCSFKKKFVKYIANVAQRTFENVKKSISANNILIYYIDN